MIHQEAVTKFHDQRVNLDFLTLAEKHYVAEEPSSRG
jgi:hypothetical protein